MIELQEVDLEYGAEKVLEGITFRSGAGELLGILGPNGSGKTTLLKAISRIVRPSNGVILVNSRSLQEFGQKELSREIAVVPQSSEPKFDFSVEEVVRMGRYPHKERFATEDEEDRRIASLAMEATGILHIASRSVLEISGGELQRVIIARALAQEPKVLLLDEPTSHLDLGQQVSILEMLKTLSRKIAVIAVFHDLNYAAHYCDRLILLHDHRILAMGDPESVFTPERIRAAFGIDVTVRRNPLTGRPAISPLWRRTENGAGGRRVHVISGAGEGADLLSALQNEGYAVSAGVLSVNDTDYAVATALGIPCISEPPFSAVSERAMEELKAALENAHAVVLTRGLWGRGNLGNLHALETSGAGCIVIVDCPSGEGEWDFTGGEASEILERLKAKGAVVTREVPSTLDLLKTIFISRKNSD
ncbi:MAG: ABC transporter ATP-binding protein [Methanomicrobiales archaeon]|nr:ABC transporter ATP-binding protein [Methanomicrobiales archaeon]